MRAMVIAVPLAALVLAAAGCGGSSDNASDSATIENVDTSAATDTAASTDAMSTDTTATGTDAVDTTATDTTATDTTATTTTDASAADDDASLADCKNFAGLSTKFAQALAAASAGADKADLQSTAKAYDALAEQVPEEIRDAFRTLAAAFSSYAEALKGLDLSSGKTPDAATLAKLASAAKSLDNTKLTAANAEITAWAKKNCQR